MSYQLESSRFQTLFESAFQDYENQTGIAIDTHPLTEKLENCHSAESIITALQNLARTLGDFRGSDGIMKSTNSIVSCLCMLSSSVVPGNATGLVRWKPLTEAFHFSDAYSTAILTYKSNKCRPRYPTRCMCLSLFLRVCCCDIRSTRQPGA
jgi:hypothetical protein